jgi:catechol 2,3-dioxygenase
MASMQEQELTTNAAEVQAAWPLRRVALRVLDLEASSAYYTKLGFAIVRDERQAGSVGLGAGDTELLTLRHLPDGKPRPRHTAGLFHFAILVPNEKVLGGFLRHCVKEDIELEGASDHLVSQALYLRDPENNGIEVYADRPRDKWQWEQNLLRMTTLPLDLRRLLELGELFAGFPAGTRLGHMHLNVGDLDTSQAFYEKLGMQQTTRYAGQAHFLSWDGYHHHLGINIWEGRNVPRQEADVSGVDFFEIARPGLEAGTLEDVDGVHILVSA